MRLLILGGTNFVGRHITETALAAGHEVTLFNRGQTNADLFPQAEKMIGDRDGGLAALAGKTWDAVIDVNGYVPRLVRDAVEALAGQVGYYQFISTISVYDDMTQPGNTEDAPLNALDDPTTEDITPETYGGLKVLCERAAEDAMPGRVGIIRPGLIVGQYDHTRRFGYWARRAAQGGDMLAPEGPDYPQQVIDARDLADFCLARLEAADTTTYHATGPGFPLTLSHVIETAARLADAEATVHWVAADFIEAHGLVEDKAFPLYFPGARRNALRLDITRAVAAGLRFTPFTQTVRAALDWEQTLPLEPPPAFGLSSPREADLLRHWRT